MTTQLKAAIPKLASLNNARSIEFFETYGFSKVVAHPSYGIIKRDHVEIHFWLCNDSRIPGETGCRINVEGIDALFKDYSAKNNVAGWSWPIVPSRQSEPSSETNHVFDNIAQSKLPCPI